MKRKFKTQPLPALLLQNKIVQLNYNTFKLGDFVISLEPEQISWWRYLIFVTIITNITLTIPFLIDGVDLPYHNYSLFHLQSSSLLIWFVPLSFFAFGFVQLVPRTYVNEGYDGLFKPFFCTTILQLACIEIFPVQIIPGIILLVGTLVSSILLFQQVQTVLKASSVRVWLQIPFSLYMGALSIITISVIAGWLSSIGYTGGNLGETSFTIILIVFTGVLGWNMAFRKQDFIFPIVMAWSDINLWIQHYQTSTAISVVALSLGIFMIWCALVTFISTRIAKPVHEELTSHYPLL